MCADDLRCKNIHIGFMCFRFELRFNYRVWIWCCYTCLAPDISTSTHSIHLHEWCEFFLILFLRIRVQHHRVTHWDSFSFYSLIELIKSKLMRGKKRKPFSLPAVCREYTYENGAKKKKIKIESNSCNKTVNCCCDGIACSRYSRQLYLFGLVMLFVIFNTTVFFFLYRIWIIDIRRWRRQWLAFIQI